jgi:hypothetical protein
MNISGVSCPVVLRLRRTPYVNSFPICVYKRMIYLRVRAVMSMLFHNIATQLLIICTLGVSCAGPSEHAAYSYMVLAKVKQSCGLRRDCSRRALKGLLSLGSTDGPVFKIIVGGTECRATKL